jgi:hypothetical protein
VRKGEIGMKSVNDSSLPRSLAILDLFEIMFLFLPWHDIKRPIYHRLIWRDTILTYGGTGTDTTLSYDGCIGGGKRIGVIKGKPFKL